MRATSIQYGQQLRLPLERADAPETFVLSDSNAVAAELLSAWPDGLTPILALHGPAGSGKSRLAAAWAERVGAVPLMGVEAALIDLFDLEGLPVMLDQADEVDDETLFHLINLVLSGGGCLLMVSREPPAAWYSVLPDLRSRLNAIRTVGVTVPDNTIFAAILRTRFAERSIVPAEDVIEYLVRRLDRSAECAAEIVAQIDEQSRPVTRSLARQMLDQDKSKASPQSGETAQAQAS